MAAAKKQQRQDQLEAKILESARRVDDDHEIDEDDLDEEEEEEFVHSATCCITGALEHQEDFHQIQQDKTALFKIIQEAGHLCFFLPKFHSELNPIERYWAILKVHTRRHCRFNINALERTMLSAVNQDYGDYIKRIFETSLRYVLLYAAGLDDQNAKKVSDAISDARQTLKKVHVLSGL